MEGEQVYAAICGSVWWQQAGQQAGDTATLAWHDDSRAEGGGAAGSENDFGWRVFADWELEFIVVDAFFRLFLVPFNLN